MKISPMPSTANTAPDANGRPDMLRSIRMNTNRTPQSFDPGSVPAPPAQTPIAQSGATSDNEGKLDPATDETKPISPQFARLAKERRALQVKERELKAREEALTAGSSNQNAVEIARLKADPLNVLLENGVTFEQLSEAILQGQANPEVVALKNQLKALEEGVDKKFEANANQQKQAALAQMKREATQLAATGDEYALVREMGHIDDVMSLIEQTYDETGEVMKVAEAMGLVEAELLKDAERLASLEKLKPKFQPPPPPMQRQQPPMRTLTNRDTAAPVLDKKQRAIAAFHGRLQ